MWRKNWSKYAQNHATNDDFNREPRRAVHRFRQRRQIKVIVAARGDGRADEYRVDEERRRDFLEPQPRMTDAAGDDIESHGRREAEQQCPAQHHQDEFEHIERAPFQMTLTVQYELVGEPHGPAPG